MPDGRIPVKMIRGKLLAGAPDFSNLGLHFDTDRAERESLALSNIIKLYHQDARSAHTLVKNLYLRIRALM